MADSALYEEQSESSQMFGPRYGMNNEEEPDRAALARECWDYFVYYQSKLVTPFNNMVRWNKKQIWCIRAFRRKSRKI